MTPGRIQNGQTNRKTLTELTQAACDRYVEVVNADTADAHWMLGMFRWRSARGSGCRTRSLSNTLARLSRRTRFDLSMQ